MLTCNSRSQMNLLHTHISSPAVSEAQTTCVFTCYHEGQISTPLTLYWYVTEGKQEEIKSE